ncbi:hypothetical protein FHW79_006071 [Azospirillum sp. OGB3]|uniref:hypothetical protein n=1 Tax=Azospirillum sp. OGB3 TaxID=2587012 RepID=UPI0018007AAE|nr:hypothetical protein [Azospirillum sp. OGB3]MBB3268396.1 hypothetical protein [Azospirillum sp. OGB3]
MITIRGNGVKSVCTRQREVGVLGGSSVARLAVAAVLSVAVYLALLGSIDVAGLGAAWAAAQDPFTYAAEKGKSAGAGFMMLIRILMVLAVIGICVYAAWKGGKVSPVWVIAILLAGVIAVKADVVVKWFGDNNPFEQL